ncbi:hypothetical protein GAY30_12930 [Azospirillum brasilense]|uniref:hypothetical protein n=1 Tax=Azospirillum brasilense TaxID=192 RepID=UPI00157A7DC9|nr:hypothetical protein [Azospirillum brasilense]NUB25789.1 hypothetical protein [Azospirillum brasilense]NUB31469.1 hypothetical protein [Azospirillum brasilense]
MKQPHVHHLCEWLRQWPKRIVNASALDRQRLLRGSATLALAFRRMPLYVMQEDIDAFWDNALFETAMDLQKAGELRLPFPAMLIEVTLPGMTNPSTGETGLVDIYIIHAVQDPDTGHIQFTPYTAGTNRLGAWLGGLGTGELRMGERRMRLWDQPPDGTEMGDYCRSTLSAAGWFLAALLAVINSPAVERETVAAPEAMNKARVSRGVAPIPAFEAVRLRLPKTVAAPAADGVGEEPAGTGGRVRRTPKPHWRRGHQRRCPSGKVTAIPATVVAWSGEGAPPAPVVQVTVGGNVVALHRD